MKKILLSIAAATFAMTAFADTTVYFSEDFEWFMPWIEANPGKIGNTIGTNDNDAKCPQMSTQKYEGKSIYETALEKGYTFPVTHSDINKDGKAVDAREPNAQIYVNECYLKFGLTNYYSGITFPALEIDGTVNDAKISFDWVTMRQGSGEYDKTELVVIVTNGDDEKQFLVEPLNIEKGAEFKWYPTTVSLAGATLTKGTKITIRNIDAQWPAQASAETGNITLRYFLDNIKVYSGDESSVAEIAVDENAPVEYYNLQGVRVANPANGLYIVKQGNKVSKQIIK